MAYPIEFFQVGGTYQLRSPLDTTQKVRVVRKNKTTLVVRLPNGHVVRVYPSILEPTEVANDRP